MDLDELQLGQRLRALRLRAGPHPGAARRARRREPARAERPRERPRQLASTCPRRPARPLGGLGAVLAAEPATHRGRAARLPIARSSSPRREDRKSFEMHRSIVRRLRIDPVWVTERAAAGVERLLASPNIGPEGRRWVEEWATAVAAGPDALERLSLLDDDHGASLRQVSPFFGVLSAEERLASLRRA